MEELKCALLGFFGSRIRPTGLSSHAASNCDPAQVTFINEAVGNVARHIPLIRAFCEANDMGRIEGFVSRSFALACRDLLEAYESIVLEKLVSNEEEEVVGDNVNERQFRGNNNFNNNNKRGGLRSPPPVPSSSLLLDQDASPSTKNNENDQFFSTTTIVELQTAFGAVLARCAEFIRKSTPKDKLESLLLSTYEDNFNQDGEEFNSSSNTSSSNYNEQDDDDDDDDENRKSSPSRRHRNNRIYPKLSQNASLTVSEKWKQIFHLLAEPLLPSSIRSSMGMKIHRSLLVNIAHWICYGNIIVDHDEKVSSFKKNSSTTSSRVKTYSDFFVVQLQNNNPSENIAAVRSTQGDLALDEWKVPFGFPMSLCTTILIAGRERRQLDLILEQENNHNSNNNCSNNNQSTSSLSRRRNIFAASTTLNNNNVNHRTSEFEKAFFANNNNKNKNKTNNQDGAATAMPISSKNNNDLRSFIKDENNRRERQDENNDDHQTSPQKQQQQRSYRRVRNNNNNNNNDDDGDSLLEQSQQQHSILETPKWAYHLLLSSTNSCVSSSTSSSTPYFLISPKTGELAIDELDRRVTRIRDSWAKQLWHHVERQGALRRELVTARDMFLCNRGDLWHTFVERSSPAILGWTFHHQHQSSDAALEVAQQRMLISNSNTSSPAIARWVLEAFRNSVSDVRLTDSDIHSRFEFFYNNNNNNSGSASSSSSSSIQNNNNTNNGAIMSFDEAGRSMFASIRLIGLKWNLPTALTHVIKPNSLIMYERLFVSNLALKFSVFCLNQCKRFASEAESMSSRAGRQFVHCVQLLHFFLSNVAYSWQVDVQDTHFKQMFDQLDKATSVEEALRSHALFVENLTAGAFLAEEGREVARCIGELVVLAFSLFALVREDSTRKTLDAIAIAEKKKAPLNPRGQELSATLERVVQTVVKKVTNVMSPIASSRRAEHRALWTRLDFNGWFSQQAERLRGMTK